MMRILGTGQLINPSPASSSPLELRVIGDFALATDGKFVVTDDGRANAIECGRLLGLTDAERQSAAAGLTNGGAEIPAAVRQLIGRARLRGALLYDVTEHQSDGSAELRWTAYQAGTPPLGNMTFDYTEITPHALAVDMATRQRYQVITGVEDGVVQYETVDAFGTGSNKPGEAGSDSRHSDLYARGRSRQRWASSCAILSDGSVHCLPASQRSVFRTAPASSGTSTEDLDYKKWVLTARHLSRCHEAVVEAEGFLHEAGDGEPIAADSCRQLLMHGWIDVEGGVVQRVEIAGRLADVIDSDAAALIDPLALLRAWGFTTADDVERLVAKSPAMEFEVTDDGVIQRFR